MPGFSDDEINSAVSKFVRSDVKVIKDPLGPTDLGSKFDETIQFLSSTLTFDPNAVFYLVFLATNKLNQSVLQALAYAEDIQTALAELTKRTSPVKRTSLLGDAAAALLTVDSIATQNSAISNPAFERYLKSVDAFRDASLTPNIKDAGQIVRPPQQARTAARESLISLDALYARILPGVVQIQSMLDEFLVLNLPVRVIQSSVRTVRSDLLSMQSDFEDTTTTADDKISQTRDAYLRLTSGKSVLSNLTTITDPRSPRMESTATLKGVPAEPEGDGVLTSATVLNTKSGPWDIEIGVNDTLSIAEDGNAPTPYTIVPSAQPVVQSYADDPYDIHGDAEALLVGTNVGPFLIPAGPDNVFVVMVDGILYSGAITVGAAVPIATVLTDIQAIPGLTTVLNITNDGSGRVKLEHVTTGPHSIAIGVDDPNNTGVIDALGFTSGQENSGTEANNQIEIDGLAPLVSLTNGSARTAAQIVSDINTWITANFPGDYLAAVVPIGPATYIYITKTKAGAQTLTMTAPSASPNREIVLRAYQTLGFSEGQSDSVKSTTAAEVAKIINDIDLITAAPVKTNFEEGSDGTCFSATVFRVPAGTINLLPPISHVGDQLFIRHGDNAGHYRIVSIVTGAFDTITVEAFRPFLFTGTVDESWIIQREVLQVTSKSSLLTTELVVGAANANATLGFTPGTTRGTTTGFRATDAGVDVSFTQADVIAGDILKRISGPNTPPTKEHTVVSVSADKQIEIDPPLPTDSSLLLDFQILSVDAIEYDQLVADLADWDELRESSPYAKDLQELTRVLNPVLNSTGPSGVAVGDASTALTELIDLLEDLTDKLVEFVVRTIPRMDAGLRMLQERGFDRAFNTLMDGEIAAFFGFDKDDASTGSFLLKSMRQIAQKDVPVSKNTTDADDKIHDPTTYIDRDPNFDHSDRDSDENEVLIGETTVIDSDDVAGQNISTRRGTY
jgi:hypothetical protein